MNPKILSLFTPLNIKKSYHDKPPKLKYCVEPADVEGR